MGHLLGTLRRAVAFGTGRSPGKTDPLTASQYRREWLRFAAVQTALLALLLPIYLHAFRSGNASLLAGSVAVLVLAEWIYSCAYTHSRLSHRRLDDIYLSQREGRGAGAGVLEVLPITAVPLWIFLATAPSDVRKPVPFWLRGGGLRRLLVNILVVALIPLPVVLLLVIGTTGPGVAKGLDGVSRWGFNPTWSYIGSLGYEFQRLNGLKAELSRRPKVTSVADEIGARLPGYDPSTTGVILELALAAQLRSPRKEPGAREVAGESTAETALALLEDFHRFAGALTLRTPDPLRINPICMLTAAGPVEASLLTAVLWYIDREMLRKLGPLMSDLVRKTEESAAAEPAAARERILSRTRAIRAELETSAWFRAYVSTGS